MRAKPKFRFGQKVIIADKGYADGKSDVGYIVGMEVRRSYSSAGVFQFGGLSISECERNGYLETYMNNVDEVVYHVIRTIHTTGATERTKEVAEDKLVLYTKENANKYAR